MNIPFHPPIRTIAELLHQLGDIPADRVRWNPIPGTATIDDLLRSENEGCELVDGTLVEKPMGQEESMLASWIGYYINHLLKAQNLGYATGEQGLVELPDGPVRGPDIAFFSWESIAAKRRPSEPIPLMAPDLAVEVLSPSNTRREMERKRGEYFRSGTRLVWEVDPRARIVRVYTAVDRFADLTEADTLDGGAVLPGFSLPLKNLFAELDRHG